MPFTLATSDASVGLSELRNSPVVAHEICPSGLLITFGFNALRNFSLIHAFVVMQKDCRDVDSIGARHAVFAVIAWNCRIFLHEDSCLFEEYKVIFCKWHQGGEALEVVLKVLHIGHSAENAEHSRMSSGKSEGP